MGLGKRSMDQAGQAVYQQLYPKIFTGSEKVDFEGAALTLNWDVKTSPTFILSPPANSQQMIQQHLAEARLPQNLSFEMMSKVAFAELKDSVLQMLLDTVDLEIASSDGKTAVNQLNVVVVVQVTTNGDGTLTLNPIKATAKTSNLSDQTLVNKYFIPRALEMARRLLSGVSLPKLSIPGVILTPPTITIQQNHVVVLANISGQSSPDVPRGVTWPTQDFFGLFSDRLRQTLIRNETRGFSQTFQQSGRKLFSIY